MVNGIGLGRGVAALEGGARLQKLFIERAGCYILSVSPWWLEERVLMIPIARVQDDFFCRSKIGSTSYPCAQAISPTAVLTW